MSEDEANSGFFRAAFKSVVRALEKAGFWIARQGKHVVMTDGTRILTVPRHNPVNAITMGNTVRDAGLTNDEFRELLQRTSPSDAPERRFGRFASGCSFGRRRVIAVVRGRRWFLMTAVRSYQEWDDIGCLRF